ncbi:MAG: hypothetical protein A3H35_20820 [Betaproteobacteria bacterium RIFCSPLOWO2_02_FULL_62_17]|nr:MAG: hypothetical protein A3H35_20820 [Betaproteobacteria bacterium RIFCSPLOWO2_02_FULL_62_17]
MSEDWHDQVSQPKYGLKAEKDVFVTMRDGVRIAVDVYRPECGEKVPALLGISPYAKDVQSLPIFEFPTDRDLGNGGIEAGDTAYFVARGYAHVIAESRGTGVSEGEYGVFGEREQQDGYDLVEWIASQPWCNGKVGMLGMSYFGMIQLLVAAQNPPHLKAIFPIDAATDMYRHWGYHGGLLHLSFLSTWWDSSLVVNHADRSPSPAAEVKPIVEALLEHPDVRSHPRLYKTLKWRDKNPHFFDVLVHPLDGPYYWERSAYTKFDKIRIPCYFLSRWTAQYIHLPGAFSAYQSVDAPKKLMITLPESGVGFNRPWHENHDIVLRWYEHWLKGIDTGLMDEAPIRVLVQGTGEWRDEQEWPLARTRWTKLHLSVQGRLQWDAPGWNERPEQFANAVGLQPGGKVPSLRYTTEPLAENIEITGPIALTLYASLSTPDAHWIVELNDIDRDGTAKRVSIGWLKASHREIDAGKSKPWKPFHPHTQVTPIEPGRVGEYAIEICDTCWVFKTGHRLELMVKAQDAPWEGTSYIYRLSNHLTPARETRYTIHHTPEYPSHLLLPVIPAAGGGAQRE